MAYTKGQFDVTQHIDTNGDPSVSYILKFFIWDTSTPTAVYSDSTGTSLGTSVTLNALGQPQTAGGTAVDIFFDTAVVYKAQLYLSDGTTTVGPVIGPFYPLGINSHQTVDSFAAAYAAAFTGINAVTTRSFLGGWSGTVAGPIGGAPYHRDGTTGTASTAYADNSGFYDANGDGFRLASPQNKPIPFSVFGVSYDGTDESTEIGYALAYSNNHFIESDAYFSAITFSADKTFSGPGTLRGLATSGAKPTRAELTGAANSAARLTDLQAYYNGELTVSANAKIYGHLVLHDTLMVGSGATYIDARGIITLDDCSLHNLELRASKGGTVDSTTGLISSDSADKGLHVYRGGIIDADSAVIVSATGRGCEIQLSGGINATSGEIYNCGDEGAYVLWGGSIDLSGSTISGNSGEGALTNYGGSIDLETATVTGNTGSGIGAESGGQIYAVGATITSNGVAGIFAQYGGTCQATGATITGNTSFAIDCRGNSVVNALTATIDTTNNSGGIQVRTLQGGIVLAEEPGVGSGKTGLSSTDYDPPYNTDGPAGSYIGDADPTAPASEIGAIVWKETTVTISSGSITAVVTRQNVDTEAFAASDDLDTIDITASTPDIIYLFPASTARTVVIKHGTGNITTTTGADITLDTNDKGSMLVRAASVWLALPLL